MILIFPILWEYLIYVNRNGCSYFIITVQEIILSYIHSKQTSRTVAQQSHTNIFNSQFFPGQEKHEAMCNAVRRLEERNRTIFSLNTEMKYCNILLSKTSHSLDHSRFISAIRQMLCALENASRAHVADEKWKESLNKLDWFLICSYFIEEMCNICQQSNG